MQLTRQRVRPANDINIEEKCPTCFGTGKMQPSVLFVDQVEAKIDYLVNELKIKKFKLHLHPYIEAFISKGWLFSLKWKWMRKFGSGCRIIPSQSMGFLQFKFYDFSGKEIDLNQREAELNSQIKEQDKEQ
jgi:ribonuclease G